MPDYKLTDQHKKWIENSLKSIASALLSSSLPGQRKDCMDELALWYASDSLTQRNTEALLQLRHYPESCVLHRKP